MPKPLSKSQIVEVLAHKTGVTKRQATAALEQIAQLAYQNAKNSFVFPGLGKLVLVRRAVRLRRNPATGEHLAVPAKQVLRFRIAKAARDSILGSHGPIANADEGNTDTNAR